MTQRPRRAFRRVDVLVGAALVLAALVAGAVAIAARHARRTPVPIQLEFDRTPHLRVGTPVRILGVEAGRLDAIELVGPEGDRSAHVVLHAHVDPQLLRVVHTDGLAIVTRPTPLGEPSIDISPGSPDAPRLAPGGTLRGQRLARGEELAALGNSALGKVRSLIAEAREPARRVVGAFEAVRDDALAVRGAVAPRLDALASRVDGLRERVRAAVASVQSWVEPLRHTLSAARHTWGAVERGWAAAAPRASRHVARARKAGARAYAGGRRTARAAAASFGALRDDAAGVRLQIERIAALLHDVRFLPAALAADGEIQNDVKALQRDLKRHLPWFLFHSEVHSPPAR